MCQFSASLVTCTNFLLPTLLNMVGQTADWVNCHFVKTGKLGNSSNRSKYKCKHCTDHAQEIKHRNNKLLNHLKDCKNATTGARREALTILMKKSNLVINTPVTNSESSTRTAASINIVTNKGSKKRTQALGGYVDYPMLDSQKNEADVKLLRSILFLFQITA